MEGGCGDSGGGWDHLLDARSEYIAGVQRMLQTACQNAASLSAPDRTANEHRVADVASILEASTQPMPADEGAGSYPVERNLSTCGISIGHSAVTDVGALSRIEASLPAHTSHHEEVANEVLRLRLLKSQHEELRAQLARAEGQLRRLSPHSVFQLRSHLERLFREPSALQMQDAIVRLVQCLFAICRVEAPANTADGLLSGSRKLLRDPHSFTSKLCGMPPTTAEEAKKMAPFLTSTTQFRRTREKEVNDCYDALHGWLEAFYIYSSISEQVGPTMEQLDKQEWLLRRLNGQAEESALRPSAAPSGAPLTPGSTTAPLSASTAPSRSSNPVIASSGSKPGQARVTASPLSRQRKTLVGSASSSFVGSSFGGRPTAALTCRARPVASESNDVSVAQHSRSISPTQRARGFGLPATTTRPRVLSSVAFGGGSPGGITSARVPIGGRSSTTALARTREHSELGTAGSSISAAPGGHSERGFSSSIGEGLARVQSEKALSRSPRAVAAVSVQTTSSAAARRDSRSPSPGHGRSPLTASTAATSSRAAPRTVFAGRRGGLSPSPSEGSIPTAQRMVSAPTQLSSSSTVGVRTVKAAGHTPVQRPGSNRTSAAAPPGRAPASASVATAVSGRSAARPGSPDKCGGAPRDAGPVEATPRHREKLAAAAVTASAEDSEGEAVDDDDGSEPQPRRLSPKQYAALIRCAQQVVSGTANAPAQPPMNYSPPQHSAPSSAQRQSWAAARSSAAKGSPSSSTAHLHNYATAHAAFHPA